MRKTTLLAFVPCALLSAGPLWAQAQDPRSESAESGVSNGALEEIIVRGRRLSDFKAALEAARVRVYDLFNELNSDDAFDVSCQYEDSTGSRIPQQVCRPRFKTDIATAAARQWRYGLISSCGGVTQECIFSDAAQQALSMAQAEESREGLMQKRFTEEMARAVLESPELRQAILNHEAIDRDYREARKRRRD